jgi:hypothetical protein
MLLVSDDRQTRCRRIRRRQTVNALVLANFPLAILVILAIVGIPLWMTFKRPETAPDYSQARAHFAAKTRRARALTAVGGPARTGMTPAYAHTGRAAQPARAA